ncbi:hypothetical protein HK100_011861 [Physocladia obscura]|uniref:Uncharacterized protein n=1 Tax=Physocladia obscura TaxID=109957 RepID=A0AAD5T2B4_9FUNG|nr:hypothetical protein HK100_011861 [Physocladia obscura]
MSAFLTAAASILGLFYNTTHGTTALETPTSDVSFLRTATAALLFENLLPLLSNSNTAAATTFENLAKRWDDYDEGDYGDLPKSYFAVVDSGKFFCGITDKERSGEMFQCSGGGYTVAVFHLQKSINCKYVADKSETTNQHRNSVENNLFVHLALQNSNVETTLNSYITTTSPSSSSTTTVPIILNFAAVSTPKARKTPVLQKTNKRLTPATLRKDRLGNKVRTLGAAVDNLRQTKAVMDLINLPIVAAVAVEAQQQSLTKKQPKTPKNGICGGTGGRHVKQLTPNRKQEGVVAPYSGKRRGRKSKSQLEAGMMGGIEGAANGLSSSPPAAGTAIGIFATASSPVVSRYPRTGVMPMQYFSTDGGGSRVTTAVNGSPLSSFHYMQSPALTRASTSNLSTFLARFDVERMNGEGDGDASNEDGASESGSVSSQRLPSTTAVAEEDPFVAAACALMLINNNGAPSPITSQPLPSSLSLNTSVPQVSAISAKNLSLKRKISTSMNPMQFRKYLLREETFDDNSDKLATTSSTSLPFPILSSKHQQTRKTLFGKKSTTDLGILEKSTFLPNFMYSPISEGGVTAEAAAIGAGSSGLSIVNSVSALISTGVTAVATTTAAVAPASLISEETAAAATAIYSLHSETTITTPSKKKRKLMPRTHSALQFGSISVYSAMSPHPKPSQLPFKRSSSSIALATSVPTQVEQKIILEPQNREIKKAVVKTKAVVENTRTTYIDSKLSIIASSPQQKAFDSSNIISISSSDCIPAVACSNRSEIEISDALVTDDDDYFYKRNVDDDDDKNCQGELDCSSGRAEIYGIMRKQALMSPKAMGGSNGCRDSMDLDNFTTCPVSICAAAAGGGNGDAGAARQ